MHTSPPRFWDGVLRRLGAEMSPLALEAWIDPLVARSHAREDGESRGRLTLGCPTAFHRDRVRERFLSEIERCAAAEAGTPVAVDLVVAPATRGDGPDPAQAAPKSPPEPENSTPRCAPAPCVDGRSAAPGPQRELPYRFDNFVVGSCNALAREASIAVARSTQRALGLARWMRAWM